MKIGIIVATRVESAPFAEALAEATAKKVVFPEEAGFTVTAWDFAPVAKIQVYLLKSGVGEIAAAAATQYLIMKFNVDTIINYGVVGGLTDETPAHTVGYVNKIIHAGIYYGPGFKEGEYPNQGSIYIVPNRNAIKVEELGIPEFICASSDRVILGGEPKRQLREKTGADICEMEAAAIARIANKNNIPVSFIKAVSDGVDEDEDAFQANVRQASKTCVKILIDTLHLPTA